MHSNRVSDCRIMQVTRPRPFLTLTIMMVEGRINIMIRNLVLNGDRDSSRATGWQRRMFQWVARSSKHKEIGAKGTSGGLRSKAGTPEHAMIDSD